jgi:bacterioferritin B
MSMNERVSAAINEQIGHEFLASQQYLAIAAYYEGEALPVLGRHFRRQSGEEREHALKFLKYLIDVGAPVRIPATPAPRGEFSGLEEPIALALEHEKKVTAQIEAIYAAAVESKDYTTQGFLQWFLQEQVEEVSSMDALLRVVRMAGGDPLRVEMVVGSGAAAKE